MEFNSINPLPLIDEKLHSWMESAFKIAPNIMASFLVLVIFYIFVKIFSRLFEAANKNEENPATTLIRKIFSVLIFSIGVFSALTIVNLDKTVTSILAGAGVLGIALGFAFQDVLSNYICGILIILNKSYIQGDIVKIENFVGTVDKIYLRITQLKTFDGLHILVPNKKMFTQEITNYTKTHLRRIDIKARVSFNEDLKKVEKITTECLKDVPNRVDELTEFFYTEIGDSSIQFQVRFWIQYSRNQNYLMSMHESILKIKAAFDKNGIHIPYPIQNVNVKEAFDSEKSS